MSEHDRGLNAGQFCGKPVDGACECGNDYRKVCKPTWSWVSYPQRQKSKLGEISYTAKKHEAHHILCIGAVANSIVSYTPIVSVVEQTKWCINSASNMLAMPRWGHTIQHYATYFMESDGDSMTAAFSLLSSNPAPPSWQNIPQHNYGHTGTNAYIDELTQELTDVAERVQKSKKAHKGKVKELKTKLKALSGDFRTKLDTRGHRCGGTHAAWQKGIEDRDSDWYEPFSMASHPRKMTFPLVGQKKDMETKIYKLVRACWAT